MTATGSGPMEVSEAAVYTGLSANTVRRRVDLWLSGDRSSRALKGGRTSGTTGDRLIDRVDAERVRLQLLGEVEPTVTPEEWARRSAG